MRNILVPFVFAAIPAFVACDDGTSPGTPIADAASGSDTEILVDATITDATATGEDIGTRPDLGSGEGVAPAERATTTLLADGVTRRTVAIANDSTLWVHVALPSGAGVAPTDPESDTAWTLAIQRYRIRVNGGTSGNGGVKVAWTDGLAFADTTTAPAGPWVTDDDTTTTPEGETAYAFASDGGWWSYDSVNHILTARPERIWYLAVPEGQGGLRHYRLQVRDYYDANGNAGVVTFEWAPVAAPPETPAKGTIRVAGGRVNFASGGLVDDGTWDLQLGTGRDIGLATNGGSSGSGLGAARLATEAFETLNETDTIGFTSDRMVPRAGPPGSGETSANPVLADWYDYNMTTHAVTPKDQVFVVRGHDGAYWKMRIAGWNPEGWTLEVAPIARTPGIHETTITAPTGGAFQYLDLQTGAIGEDVAAPWDLAFSGVNMRTFSGTSGDGLGGAIAFPDAAVESIDTAPTDGWVVDTMMPIPGPPGSGETSGNAALAAWYDYNRTTHAVTPKPMAFAIRLRDGSFARMAVRGWASGTWTIAWSWAGPGHTTF